MILNKEQSKAHLHLCDNKECATDAINLPDGNPNAERVMTGRNRKTGKATYSICCPWMLCDIFSK